MINVPIHLVWGFLAGFWITEWLFGFNGYQDEAHITAFVIGLHASTWAVSKIHDYLPKWLQIYDQKTLRVIRREPTIRYVFPPRDYDYVDGDGNPLEKR